MRLFMIASAVVIGFALGVWGLSRLLPATAPAWIGLMISMVWLFLLVFGAVLCGNKSSEKVYDQRRLLGYGLFAAILMVCFLVPLFAYDVKLPKWAAEGVLAAIAGAVFLFSTYVDRRELRRNTK